MGHYDQMQACLNGHLITDHAQTKPQFRAKFCKRCGASAIDCCPSCQAPIKGDYLASSVLVLGYTTPVPAYCENCGAAYPWRQAAIDNLSDVLRESMVSEQDIAAVEATLPDVVRDTPKTEGAALKLKRLMGQLSRPTYEIAIKVVTDLASEAAKKTMGLS